MFVGFSKYTSNDVMNSWNPCIWTEDCNNFSVNDSCSDENCLSSSERKVLKFQSWTDWNPGLCDAGVGLHYLSYRANWELAVKCVVRLALRKEPGPVSRKSRKLFGPQKPSVRFRSAYSVKLVFSCVVNGRKIKITAKFRASRRLRFEHTKRIMPPEMRPKSFGTFEKRAPGL